MDALKEAEWYADRMDTTEDNYHVTARTFAMIAIAQELRRMNDRAEADDTYRQMQDRIEGIAVNLEADEAYRQVQDRIEGIAVNLEADELYREISNPF